MYHMFPQKKYGNPHIREGSCDTEDWSNDAENHRNKLHFIIYSHREQMIYIIIIFNKFTVY